jgi:predicted oxidoreductase
MNPEDKVIFTRHELLGAMAHFIVAQSPELPSDLSLILRAFDKWIDQYPPPGTIDMFQDMTMITVTSAALYDWLHQATHTIHQIKRLNLSQKEVEAGLTADDVDDNTKRLVSFTFVSRYTFVKKEYDFVDLGALARNVANYLKWDHERTQSIGKDISFDSNE